MQSDAGTVQVLLPLCMGAHPPACRHVLLRICCIQCTGLLQCMSVAHLLPTEGYAYQARQGQVLADEYCRYATDAIALLPLLPQPPFNEEARAKAGFGPEWYLPVARAEGRSQHAVQEA